MNRIDAAVQQHDAGRRPFRQHVPHVGVADVLRVEREQSILQFAVRRDRLAGRTGAPVRIVEWLRRAAGDRDEKDDEQRAPGTLRFRGFHERALMRWIMSSRILSMTSGVNAAVRYDTPAQSVSPAVVTARTSGAAGPVGTPRM